MFTTEAENFRGFPKGVSGHELMGSFRAQAEHQGAELITADVQKVAMCTNVTLAHRRQEFRASKAMQQRFADHPRIRILRNHVVTEVLDVVDERVPRCG